jgi:hypothetical protein
VQNDQLLCRKIEAEDCSRSGTTVRAVKHRAFSIEHYATRRAPVGSGERVQSDQLLGRGIEGEQRAIPFGTAALGRAIEQRAVWVEDQAAWIFDTAEVMELLQGFSIRRNNIAANSARPKKTSYDRHGYPQFGKITGVVLSLVLATIVGTSCVLGSTFRFRADSSPINAQRSSMKLGPPTR